MEPRCNHLGNPLSSFTRAPKARPQWSPGVITWETGRDALERRHLIASMEPRCNHLGNSSPSDVRNWLGRPQWSPGVITWETRRRPGSAPHRAGLNGAQV